MPHDQQEAALQELQAFLANRVNVQRQFNSHAKGNQFPYICMEDFVLQHGHACGERVTEGYARGEPQQCFYNSQRLAIDDERLTYFEGFATGIIPIHHAWCCDEQGRVIDTTWDDTLGRAYIGVPFSAGYLLRRFGDKLNLHSLLNDWQNDFPLLSGAHDVNDALQPWPPQQPAPAGPSL